MKPIYQPRKQSPFIRSFVIAIGTASFCQLLITEASATVSFLGVAAGDATSSDAIVWTRAIDSAAPTSSTTLTLKISPTSPTLASGVTTLAGQTTDTAHDFTCKVTVGSLIPATVYYYQFVGSGGELSNIGKFKTPPAPSAAAPLHFAFSGDYDGLMRPYTLGNGFTANSFDFFMNIGDTIYETASTGSAAVAASGAFAAGSPTNTSGATPTTLYTDYTRKYREQFVAINSGGQNCLQDFFAAQGNYTLLDNHELGNKQYMHGGAAAGGNVSSSLIPGAGVDPANTANDVNTTGTFINKTAGFTTLVGAYSDYQPIKNRGLINAPSDLRTNGTQQLYMSQQWGKNAILLNTDTRSYRDIRLRTAGNADDTGSRADNVARTYFGATQLAWIEQTLLTAQNTGTPWKFVAISDPIDQIGPIGGVLTGTLTGVNSDGGKALMGGYRYERNQLLKFIADHQIQNVVFLTTDDHQNRINEILYSPTGQTNVQSSYVKVPYCFEVVDGPFGATGPETITNHSFSNIKAIADDLANKQSAAGVEPIGLAGYPGLHDVKRDQDGTLVNEATPQFADFYSPDTFNYNVLDVSADGKTLSVKSVGVNSYAQNNRVEAGTGNQATNAPHTIFSFQVDAANPLNNITNFIVVYQENWSFDALYGSFPGANGRANATAASLDQKDRLTGASLSTESGTNNYNNVAKTSPLQNTPPQPLNASNVIDTHFPTSLNTLAPYDVASYIPASSTTGDIVHKYWQEQFQAAGALSSDSDLGNNSGFVTWSDNPGLVMSFFDATNLPEGKLAQQYTMCDNFFHSAFGGSFLNHQFLIAAAPPVYPSMPTSNNGAIAYLDSTGLFGLNTSGGSAGKFIRDGSITPVVGDSLTGLTINGVSGQSATVIPSGTPSDAVFADGSHFNKHYVVNTTFTANMCPTFSVINQALMPSLNNTNPAGVEYTQNIGDILDAGGVSWKWYSGGWDKALAASKSNPLHLGANGPVAADTNFQWHHQAFAYFDKTKPFDAAQPDGLALYAKAHLQDEAAHLYADIANSTLPQVSFVKFLGDNNEHPGYASLQQGQQHVADLVAAVQANPTLWAHTAIIITYDEHGGRWDHVTPPTRDIWGPGVRVPTIVISPYAKKGYVHHAPLDTSSILSTIEQRFGLPSLNGRDGSAPSMSEIFTNLRISRSGYVLNRISNTMTQTVKITNGGTVPMVGPIYIDITNLSANTSLLNATGTTATTAPLGSSYVKVSNSDLAPGATVSAALRFIRPAAGTGTITYTASTFSGTQNP